MVSYKKIFIIFLFLGLLFICTPVFASTETQPWAYNNYSPTFEANYGSFARSTHFLIIGDKLVVFYRATEYNSSSVYIRLNISNNETYIRCSNNDYFGIIPIISYTSGIPTSAQVLDFDHVQRVYEYTFPVPWTEISFTSVDLYNGTFSRNNLLVPAGVGVFLGNNDFTDTTVDWFSRYSYLQGVFEDDGTLYYKESKNINIDYNTQFTLTAFTSDNTIFLWGGVLSDWSYDNINDIFYFNLPSNVMNTIHSMGYNYFRLTASHTVNAISNTRSILIYAPNTYTGGGGGDDPGGGGSGGSFDDTEILNSISDLDQSIQSLDNSVQSVDNSVQSVDNSIQEQTDFLTDDTISDSSFTLPSDSSQDVTKDGINNVFTLIYNGFTSGTAPDIVLPIPFTNKSITISANYTYNILNGNQAFSVIYALIQAFYWYFISVFIVSDISHKITKIKGGNLENIANSNIKEEML